ncbi:MAG TPA: hypothetical protein VL913_00785, partial [Candidatus Micrarchaeaceae archaeon]|nr:hypothetical protein [Candidatus Micrarchaeaceae archaeon]
VEGQVEQLEANDGQAPGKGNKNRVTPEQLAARRESEVLRLSRARVQRSLEGAGDERYREQLRRALADLDEKIAALSAKT